MTRQQKVNDDMVLAESTANLMQGLLRPSNAATSRLFAPHKAYPFPLRS